MPTIIESCPISITLGDVQMTGYMFVAANPDETIVDGQISVLGIIQTTIRLVATDQDASVDVTLHEGIFTFSLHFDVPTSSFLCELQPKDADQEAEWHLLAKLPADKPKGD